ncbi:MAG TPA: hypothetical protein DCM05_02930 [Elusimicrobia bacterium]|nr:hypothetical protein [Elusimicrobiota bacterium]
MANHEEMLKACRVPEPILQKMSTAGLVETVLNYPLYGEIRVHNSPQQGFDAIAEFSGIQELLSRKDAGSALLERYRTMDPAGFGTDSSAAQKGLYTWRFEDIEILLAQETVLANLTEAQRHYLLKEGIAKYQAKSEHKKFYGMSGKQSVAMLIGRILLREKPPAFMGCVQEDVMLQTFLSKGFLANDSTLEKILAQAQEFLLNK